VFPSALESLSDLSTEELRERLQEVTEVRTGRRMTFDLWFAMVQLVIILNEEMFCAAGKKNLIKIKITYIKRHTHHI
jgi:hypothetical protein